MAVDVVKKIAEAVKILYGEKVNQPEENVEEEEEALETISEYVEDINYAMGKWLSYLSFFAYTYILPFIHFSGMLIHKSILSLIVLCHSF